jgi:hypothetical protein
MWQAHRFSSSAWTRMAGGIVRRRAWAVLRLITHLREASGHQRSLPGPIPAQRSVPPAGPSRARLAMALRIPHPECCQRGYQKKHGESPLHE